MIIGNGYGNTSSNRLSQFCTQQLDGRFLTASTPPLFISAAANRNLTGRIGIGNVTQPEAKLHIKSDPGEKANLFIEQENFRQADIMLGDIAHGIRSTDAQGLIFRTHKRLHIQ